jgi:hypothetical protein
MMYSRIYAHRYKDTPSPLRGEGRGEGSKIETCSRSILITPDTMP